jgi:hypothetical protein
MLPSPTQNRLGTRDLQIFEAGTPRPVMSARLRIADRLSAIRARLATGPLAGLWPDGARTRWTTNRIL